MSTILDTKLIDLMPESFREIDEVRWLCAAAQPQIDEIVAELNKILFMRLDGLDDITLDYLLTECGIANSLEMVFLNSRQDKINFIQNYVTLKRYKGTKKGLKYVLEMLGINALIYEWFEYSGKPFTFKISIPDSQYLPQDLLDKLDDLIQAYKNTRSHYSYDDYKRLGGTFYAAGSLRVQQRIKLRSGDLRQRSTGYFAGALRTKLTIKLKGN